MKLRFGAMALLLAGLCVGTSSADDPSGVWRWEHQSLETQETVKDVLKIKVDGSNVSGTYQGEQGEVQIEDGKWEGDTLSWSFTLDAEGQEIPITFLRQGQR